MHGNWVWHTGGVWHKWFLRFVLAALCYAAEPVFQRKTSILRSPGHFLGILARALEASLDLLEWKRITARQTALYHLWVPKEASQDQRKCNTHGAPLHPAEHAPAVTDPPAGQHTWYRVSNTLDRLLMQGCRVLMVILTFLLPSAKSFPMAFSNVVKKAESWFYRIWNMSECITSAVNSLPSQKSNAGFTLFFHLSVRSSAAGGCSA